jgi:hypothetical protein
MLMCKSSRTGTWLMMLNSAQSIFLRICNTMRTLYTTILYLGFIRSMDSEMLNYSHNCTNVGYSTIRKLLLINMSGLDRVNSLFVRCAILSITLLLLPKLNTNHDNGKTTTERWHYFIAFFSCS